MSRIFRRRCVRCCRFRRLNQVLSTHFLFPPLPKPVPDFFLSCAFISLPGTLRTRFHTFPEQTCPAVLTAYTGLDPIYM